ncbi:MAG: BON domain-containing protein [Acidobacteria bacterium]|nr:BON domain-containing protein [Acidobacteriota bacterium]MCA1651196.1 BON domain-containing protein [Acidobacteriota bacterium]
MFRALFRLVLLVVILVAGAAFFLGWWSLDTLRERTGVADRPLGTTGQIDTAKAREVGAQVGEKTAVAAAEAQSALAQGTLTAKIKSKMALDDLVRARSINVDTSGGVATLTGTVSSEAERQRALQLARETNGVTSVVDRLVVR